MNIIFFIFLFRKITHVGKKCSCPFHIFVLYLKNELFNLFLQENKGIFAKTRQISNIKFVKRYFDRITLRFIYKVKY